MRRELALALLLAGLRSSFVIAQPAAPEQPETAAVEAAKTAFADAEKAFANKDYEVALALFRLAFEKAPRDAVRFNIAVCLAELGRYEEAHAEYELAAASKSLTDSERALALQRADDLALRLKPKEPTPGPPPPPPARKVERREGLAGWLTITGSIVAAIGTAGVIGFGARTSDLGDEYLENPTRDLRDEGLLMRGLTNGSIGVLGLGALLIVGDLALLRTGEKIEWVVAPTALGVRASF